MADKFQPEATTTLRSLGLFTIAIPDSEFNAGVREAGHADRIYIGRIGDGLYHGAVEVKTGRGEHRQSWPFAEWSDEQRRWAQAWREKTGTPYLLFIMVGNDLPQLPKTESRPYPRIAVLVPHKVILDLEAAAERKSLSYQQIADMQTFRLNWAGKGRWIIPPCNPFWSGVTYDLRSIVGRQTELRERRAG
ncbi:MAG: hypothetical protein IPK52_00115 [Chloroflexi bacterium]|nr:hypothetical protein [Chloroflexota bacterium]